MKQKLKISHNQEEENRYKRSIEAKISAFQELLDYCNQFISIEDIKAFSEAPSNYFKIAFTNQYINDFPSIVGYEKRLELCGINEAKIQKLENIYSGIEISNFDPERMEAPDKDFNIYAIDSEAEKRYQKTKKLCDLLNELRSEQTIYPANVIQGLSGSIAFSFQTNQFEINVNYVNQIRSRAY
jgi:hypothetical protein